MSDGEEHAAVGGEHFGRRKADRTGEDGRNGTVLGQLARLPRWLKAVSALIVAVGIISSAAHSVADYYAKTAYVECLEQKAQLQHEITDKRLNVDRLTATLQHENDTVRQAREANPAALHNPDSAASKILEEARSDADKTDRLLNNAVKDLEDSQKRNVNCTTRYYDYH